MKKRSDSNKTSELPLDSLHFFLDENNTATELIDALKALGAQVHLQREHFDRGTPDVVWLPIVAGKGWIVLTRDDRLRYNPLEKQVLLQSAARVFILTQPNASGAQMAQTIRFGALSIARFLKRHKKKNINKSGEPQAGFVARIPRDGSVVEC